MLENTDALLSQTDRLYQLKILFPEFFDGENIDIDAFARFLNTSESINEQYGLQWEGKNKAALEATTPAVGRLVPLADKHFEEAEHLFVEGDNLQVIKLLKNDYAQKIKMIYIDPPYNTGDESLPYADNFKQKKKSKNQQEITSGFKHNSWLNMMYPRLILARDLLSEEGAIFISIDNREVFNLKLLCDSVFGEENYVGEVIWVNRTTPNDARRNFATDHEFVLIYAKNTEKCHFKGVAKDLTKYKNPDRDPHGAWIADNPSAASGNESYRFPITNPHTGQVYYPPKGRFWAFAPQRVEQWVASGKIVFPKEQGKRFVLKKYLSELRSDLKPFSSVLQGILTAEGTRELKGLFGEGSPFKYPKPTALIKFFISQFADNDDIIMDFFAGSASTAHAVLALNAQMNGRLRFICVQLPEAYHTENPIYREQFQTISQVAIARIELVIKELKKENPDFSQKFNCLKFESKESV